MKPALIRLASLILVCSAGGALWAQAPTPFGTPSLLPVQGQYANWQPHRAAHPAPQYGTPYQAPTAYRGDPAVPMQYAASRMQTPVTPDVPQVENVPRPGLPGRSVMPGPRLNNNALNNNALDNNALDNNGLDNNGFNYGGDGPWDASGCQVDCDPCCEPCCEPVCEPCFYGSVGGMFFTRNRNRFRQISYDDTDLVGQVLSTDSSSQRWDGGGIATIGWILDPCCGCALELTYWGIYGDMAETSVYASSLAGNLNTAFDLSPLNIGATNVNDLFDAAQVHRIRRQYDVQNVEVNLLGGRMPGMGVGFRTSYLAGFRYMRFSEDFYYASSDGDPTFGIDPANEAFYDISTRNNLFGVQLGGRADWFVTPRFSLYAAPKFGLYANYMEHHSRIYNSAGSAVVGGGNPLAGGVYDISSNNTITTFLGEIDLGLNFQFTHCLGASVGYRAIAISGVAFATDQIPNHFADLPGVAAIDSNAHMLLHGGYAAVTLTW